jgi:hypothetical protein
MKDRQDARVILALAAEADADSKYIWDRIKITQTEMFGAGPVAIKVAYFGAEGALQTRPLRISTRWITDANAMADILNRAQAGCVCGCFVEIGSVLQQALRETQQGPVQAVIIVGDNFHGDLGEAVTTAKQLRAVGTRLFLIQEGRSESTEHAFRILAEVTGGAYVRFNPHIERIARRLPGMLEAVTHFAIGGTAALEALRDNESAVLLLEQMNAAGQIEGGGDAIPMLSKR